MKKLLLLCGLLVLAGCQGTPIGDAMTGSAKLAEQDDAYCRSIGAKPNTDIYTQCRMYKTQERNNNHQRAYQRAAGGFSNMGSSTASPMNRPVNCTSTGSGTHVGQITRINTTCY